MAITAGELQILITANTKAIDEIKQKLQSTQKTTTSFIGEIGKLTAGMFTAQAAFGLAQKGLSLLKDTLLRSISLSRDLAESQNKLDVVFSHVAASANKQRDILVKSFGLSTLAATNLLGATGDILSGFGFAQEKALSLSTQVQQLAVDLTSFKNIEGGSQRASESLTKALLGETESAKLLGITIREEDVQARLKLKGMDKLTGQARLQALAEERLQIALEQAKNAMGDFARTSDSLANRQRTLKSVQEDILTQLGSTLTPSVNKFTGEALKASQALKDWLSHAENLHKVEVAIKAITFPFFVLGRILAVIIGQVIGVARNIGTVIKAFSLLGQVAKGNFKEVGKGLQEIGSEIVDNYKDFGKLVLDNVKGVGKDFVNIFKSEVVKPEIKKDFEAAGKDIAQSIKKGFSEEEIDKGFGFTTSLLETLGNIGSGIGDIINNVLDNNLNNLRGSHELEIEAIDERLAREIELLENHGMTKAEMQAKELEDLQTQLANTTDLEEQANITKEIDKITTAQAIKAAEDKARKEKEEAEKAFAKKEYEIEVQQFNIKKAMDLTNAGISLAVIVLNAIQAAMNAASQSGIAAPVVFGVYTAILTTLGSIAAGIQIAAIASKQPPPPPRLEGGSSNFPGGMALVGERGTEMVNLPSGSQVFNANTTRDMLKPMNVFVSVFLDSESIPIRKTLIRNMEMEAVIG